MMHVVRFGVLALLIGIATGSQAQPAGNSARDRTTWRMEVRPYFFLAGVSGSVTTPGQTFPINSSFEELLDNLRPSAFVAFTAERGPWGGYADLQYISLVGEATNAAGTSLELRNVIAEVDLTYRPAQASTLQFLAGLRAYSVDQRLAIASQGLVEANTTVVDPIVGAAGVWALTPHWSFEVRGDIGGFGIGSEFTNQLIGLFIWQMSHAVSLPFGYRVLGYQIKTGDVVMNTQMGGLVVGLEIRL